jgi:hypothetical protein
MDNLHMKLTSKSGWVCLTGAKTRGPLFNRLHSIDTSSMIDRANYSTTCEFVMEPNGLVSIIYSERSSQNIMPRIKEFV